MAAGFIGGVPAGMRMWVIIGDAKQFPLKFRVLEHCGKIHSAWYGPAGLSIGNPAVKDVTKICRRMKKGQELNLSVGFLPGLFGGDPAPGKLKTLTVVYKSLMEQWEIHASPAITPLPNRILHNCGKIHRAYFGVKGHFFGSHLVVDVTDQVRKHKNGHTLDFRAKKFLKNYFNLGILPGGMRQDRKLTVVYKPKGKVGPAAAIPVDISAARGSGGVEQKEAVIVKPAAPGLPAGWEARTDPATGRTFYINHHTKITQWDMPVKPAGAVIIKPAAPGVVVVKPGGGGRARLFHKAVKGKHRMRFQSKMTGKNLQCGIRARVAAQGATGNWATFIVHRNKNHFSFQSAGNQGHWLRMTKQGEVDGQGKGGPWCNFEIIEHGGKEISIKSTMVAGHIGFDGQGKLKNGFNTGTGPHSRFIWTLV